MPGWVQFDRPQRCWFWLLYSCVHRCAAAAALTRAVGMLAVRLGLRLLASVLQDARCV